LGTQLNQFLENTTERDMHHNENINIVIIGGFGLIGMKLALKLLELKANVIIADISIEQQQNIIEILNKHYISYINKLHFYKLDITNQNELQDFLKYLGSNFPFVDAVVNLSYPRGKNYGKDLFDITYEDFCETVNLHLGGYFLVMKEFSKFFIKQGFGNIINTSSIYGVIAPKFEIYNDTSMTMPVEYAAIKSSIIHLTKYFAKYLKNKNIRVNCVSPGGILNNQDEIFLKNYSSYCINKGMLDVDDIIGTYLFLLSDESKYINGQNIIVDDGFTL